MYVCMYELCSNGIVLLTARRECLCSSLRAAYAPSVLAEDSLCAGIAFADACAGLGTLGFFLHEVLIANVLPKMNKVVLDVADTNQYINVNR